MVVAATIGRDTVFLLTPTKEDQMANFKFCEKCDYATPMQDYKYCEKCGTELTANCPHCKKPFASEPYKFCGMCGEAIRPSQENF